MTEVEEEVEVTAKVGAGDGAEKMITCHRYPGRKIRRQPHLRFAAVAPIPLCGLGEMTWKSANVGRDSKVYCRLASLVASSSALSCDLDEASLSVAERKTTPGNRRKRRSRLKTNQIAN